MPPLHATFVCAVTLAENELPTVTFIVATKVPQELFIKYEIVVVPLLIPVTTPPVLTVPTAVLVLLHVPPAVVLDSVVVPVTVTVFVPVIAATDAGKTFIVLKALNVPHPLAL